MRLIMALTTATYILIGLPGAVAQNAGAPGQNLLDPSLNNPPATPDQPPAQDGPRMPQSGCGAALSLLELDDRIWIWLGTDLRRFRHRSR